MTPSRRRRVVSYWHDIYQVSERRACRVARMAVSTFRYESRQEPRTALRLRIRKIAQTRVRHGYRKIRVLLNREGWKVGKKLVYRLYRAEGLTLRHKPRRKRRAAMIGASGSGPRRPTRCGARLVPRTIRSCIWLRRFTAPWSRSALPALPYSSHRPPLNCWR